MTLREAVFKVVENEPEFPGEVNYHRLNPVACK
jgi:hypothetical protein